MIEYPKGNKSNHTLVTIANRGAVSERSYLCWRVKNGEFSFLTEISSTREVKRYGLSQNSITISTQM